MVLTNKLNRFGLAASLCGLLFVAGCGFHLAGERPLPPAMQTVYIDFVDPYKVTVPPVQEALRKQIEQRGGRIKSKIEQTTLQIRLSNLGERQDVTAIGPDGKAVEYRLITSIRYEVDVGGKILLGPDTLSASQDFSFSSDQILATQVQTDRLRDYTQEQIAELLLLRIEAALSAHRS